MVTLRLVRHGRTAWNAKRRLLGWEDVSLDEEGRRQASRLRESLAGRSYAGVWSSDLRRAVETARLAYGEPMTDARLREIDFGTLEGRVWEDLEPDVRRSLLAVDDFAAPEGETYLDFRRRVLGFVEALSPGEHLVFTHGGVIRLLAGEVGGMIAHGATTSVEAGTTD